MMMGQKSESLSDLKGALLNNVCLPSNDSSELKQQRENICPRLIAPPPLPSSRLLLLHGAHVGPGLSGVGGPREECLLRGR